MKIIMKMNKILNYLDKILKKILHLKNQIALKDQLNNIMYRKTA